MWWRKKVPAPQWSLSKDEIVARIETTISAVVRNIYAEDIHLRIEELIRQEVARQLEARNATS